MNNYNERDNKKDGFWSALSNLFGGGSSAMGGASSGGLGSAGGLGGLFATKAGIVGMVLGGATIAAGVGVVYNFIGPSSKPAYSPELFQNSYYEEESSKAGAERAQARNSSSAEASTLDMFAQQAKKDGMGGLASEASDQDKANAEAGSPAAGASADAGAPGAEAGAGSSAGAGAPKLQAAAGFGGKGGGGSGSGASMPKMQGNGGMSGGIGGQFQSVYKAPAQASKAGKSSAMTASAAKVSSAGKYAVPTSKGKGALSQAVHASKLSGKAATYGGAQSSSLATQAMSGETSGSGDVGAVGTGAGLGGAGVSNGAGLKGNDPSLSANNSTPPAVPDPTNVSPWQHYADDAMNSMMWAGGLILLTMGLSKLAKYMATTVWGLPYSAAVFYAAMVAAAAAIVFALKVVYDGFRMFSEYGQKMMGGIYMLTGLLLAYKAYEALMSAYNDAQSASTQADTGKPATSWGDKGPVTTSGSTTVSNPASGVTSTTTTSETTTINNGVASTTKTITTVTAGTPVSTPGTALPNGTTLYSGTPSSNVPLPGGGQGGMG